MSDWILKLITLYWYIWKKIKWSEYQCASPIWESCIQSSLFFSSQLNPIYSSVILYLLALLIACSLGWSRCFWRSQAFLVVQFDLHRLLEIKCTSYRQLLSAVKMCPTIVLSSGACSSVITMIGIITPSYKSTDFICNCRMSQWFLWAVLILYFIYYRIWIWCKKKYLIAHFCYEVEFFCWFSCVRKIDVKGFGALFSLIFFSILRVTNLIAKVKKRVVLQWGFAFSVLLVV